MLFLVILFVGYFNKMHSATQLCHNMKSCFYVDNALMIISWKRDVESIQMQNIILYVVAVGSSPPLFYSSFSILYPLGTNVTTWCYLKILSISNVCLIFKHGIRGKKTLPIVSVQDWTGSTSISYNAIVSFAKFSKKNRDKASFKNQGEKLNFHQVWRIDIVLTSEIQSICTSFSNKASNETLAITHHRAKVTYQYLNRYQFYRRSYVSRQILWISGLWYGPKLTYGTSCTLS